MPVNEPFPELDEVIASIGAAGHRIAAIDASEGAAGNISVCLGWPVEVRRRFPLEEPIELPVPAPSLTGRTVIVTGSGRRLGERRLDRGWTQADLARALGVSRQTVISIERGRFDPSLPLAFLISQTFGCRIEDVFTAEPAAIHR